MMITSFRESNNNPLFLFSLKFQNDLEISTSHNILTVLMGASQGLHPLLKHKMLTRDIIRGTEDSGALAVQSRAMQHKNQFAWMALATQAEKVVFAVNAMNSAKCEVTITPKGRLKYNFTAPSKKTKKAADRTRVELRRQYREPKPPPQVKILGAFTKTKKRFPRKVQPSEPHKKEPEATREWRE